LEKLVVKGENIVKFSNMCYKLETNEEKIIAGQKPMPDETEELDAANSEQSEAYFSRNLN